MSFETYEESRALGEPVDLFYFRYGSLPGAFFAYTDAEEPVNFLGVEYVPLTIKRGDINASGTLDKSALLLNCPMNSGIADLYRVYPPGQVISIIIRQGHINDPDGEFPVIFTGRVLQCKRDGSEAELTCEPIATSMRRSGLRRNWQLSCPHVLYGPQCRASKLAATTAHVVVNIPSATRITLTDGWYDAINPVKYIGGMVEWETSIGMESRTILRIIDLKTLILSGPTPSLLAGDTISVILGCNHQLGAGPQPDGDCGPLHNNYNNFGGHPWIPTENPINTNPFN